MKILFLSAALLLSFSAGATTPAPAAQAPLSTVTAPAAGATPAADEDKMLCERVKELGSNRLKRVCKTVGQRQREREAARESMETGSRDR